MKYIFGNSSSGIREASYFGTPAVNIGNRQSGRETSKNIINVNHSAINIVNAVNKQIKIKKYSKSFLYGNGNAGKKISKILSNTKLDIFKKLNYI